MVIAVAGKAETQRKVVVRRFIPPARTYAAGSPVCAKRRVSRPVTGSNANVLRRQNEKTGSRDWLPAFC